MDGDSSYTFARRDGTVSSNANRGAAHELLTETGTDTSSIDVWNPETGYRYGNGWTPTTPRAPRPGATPLLYPARGAPDTTPNPDSAAVPEETTPAP